MTSFHQVKQVKPYSSSLAQVPPPLWMCTKGKALHLQLGSMTGASEGCSEVRSLRILPVCVLCVVRVPGAGWAHKAANANLGCHVFCYSVSAPLAASLVLLFPVLAPSPCGLLLFFHSHFFLREKRRSLAGKTGAASSVPYVQHLGHSPFRHGRLGCWSVTEVSLPFSIYQVWHNKQSQLRYFWLTVSQHAMHCAIYLALFLTTEINEIHTIASCLSGSYTPH